MKLHIWRIGYENPSQRGVQYKAQGGEDRESMECDSCKGLHPQLVDVGLSHSGIELRWADWQLGGVGLVGRKY